MRVRKQGTTSQLRTTNRFIELKSKNVKSFCYEDQVKWHVTISACAQACMITVFILCAYVYVYVHIMCSMYTSKRASVVWILDTHALRGANHAPVLVFAQRVYASNIMYIPPSEHVLFGFLTHTPWAVQTMHPFLSAPQALPSLLEHWPVATSHFPHSPHVTCVNRALRHVSE